MEPGALAHNALSATSGLRHQLDDVVQLEDRHTP